MLTERSVVGFNRFLSVALVLLKQSGFPFALLGMAISLVVLAVRTRSCYLRNALIQADQLWHLFRHSRRTCYSLVLLTQFAWQQYSRALAEEALPAPISALRSLF